MASRLHRTLALVLSCNIAMTAFTASAFAADDTETASEGASVVHEHNKVNCPTCGGSHKVKVEETCPTCEGVVPEVPMVTCPDCDGDGEYQTWDFDHPCPICHETGCKDNPNCIMGYELYTVTCKTCGGAGEIPDPNAEKCETCGGKGTISVDADCPDCEDGTVDCPKTDHLGRVPVRLSDHQHNLADLPCVVPGGLNRLTDFLQAHRPSTSLHFLEFMQL